MAKKKDPLITTVSKLWKILQQKGLNVKTYDQDIEAQIAKELKLSVAVMRTKIKANQITIEDFLSAFFKAVQPYAMMMTDLLVMFEQSGINKTNDNLEIEFDFGSGNDFNFDINKFKAQRKRWQKISETFITEKWDVRSLFDLAKVFELPEIYSSKTPRLNRKETANRILQNNDHPLFKWKEAERHEGWTDVVPERPISNNPELDELIARIWNVLQSVHEATIAYGLSRPNVFYAQDINESSWSRETLKILASDRWADTLLDNVISGIESINNDAVSGLTRATTLARYLKGIFKGVSKVKEKSTRSVEVLLEFLDLPIWKKRHELYSVWISSQIKLALDPYRVAVHQAGGKLEFKFSGTHFATVEACQPKLHIWSELRSPLKNPVGKSRKKAIQPDYSLVVDPITKTSSTILVVECKQYMKASARNFKDALTDYAKGRPKAHVVLVNYGPAKSELTSGVSKPLQSRVSVIGEMHPGSAVGLSAFRDVVLTTIHKHYPKLTVPSKPVRIAPLIVAKPIKVKLSWTRKSIDLDVHLIISGTDGRTISVNYENLGSLKMDPFAQLRSDVKDAGEAEVLEIHKQPGNKYKICVHNYSANYPISECGATLVIEMDDRPLIFECPQIGHGLWWEVAEIDSDTNKTTILNRTLSVRPA